MSRWPCQIWRRIIQMDRVCLFFLCLLWWKYSILLQNEVNRHPDLHPNSNIKPIKIGIIKAWKWQQAAIVLVNCFLELIPMILRCTVHVFDWVLVQPHFCNFRAASLLLHFLINCGCTCINGTIVYENVTSLNQKLPLPPTNEVDNPIEKS